MLVAVSHALVYHSNELARLTRECRKHGIKLLISTTEEQVERLVEQAVRGIPAQYQWSYKRFRTRPEVVRFWVPIRRKSH